jgi:hypothetical protein
MNDETKRKALNEITQDINSSRLSRRGLLNRLKGMGVAFGAAVMLGVKESDAHNGPAATARLKSTRGRASTSGRWRGAPDPVCVLPRVPARLPALLPALVITQHC